MIFATHSKRNQIRNTPRFSEPKYVLAAENYGDSAYVISLWNCRLQKQTTKIWSSMRQFPHFLSAFANGSVSQNWLHIENRRNCSAANTYFGSENRGVLRIWFGFEWMWAWIWCATVLALAHRYTTTLPSRAEVHFPGAKTQNSKTSAKAAPAVPS